tara:strand:- start:211 stop:381 length:171 start_codon:yes stop_codon:yes gene_type:complete
MQEIGQVKGSVIALKDIVERELGGDYLSDEFVEGLSAALDRATSKVRQVISEERKP